MKFLPIILVLSLLSVTQGRRDNIRHQIRKRNSLVEAVDLPGAVKTGGSGTIGTLTQGFYTFGNVIDKIELLRHPREELPKNSTPSTKPSVIAGFGTPGTVSTSDTGPRAEAIGSSSSGTNTDAESNTPSSNDSPSDDGSRGNRNEKRTTNSHSSLGKYH
ncbi:hypothetical protein K501DRAFT_277055 [Backusella circina FSU 941]|nr:hypothetical protein K501DRAFT_280510 [Backusella circina FSU 941]KAI8878917.1 hypothetical protein K501DRAFT_277055 [Backusella circina FSU 941]